METQLAVQAILPLLLMMAEAGVEDTAQSKSELMAFQLLLTKGPLLTILGSPGVGKTRFVAETIKKIAEIKKMTPDEALKYLTDNKQIQPTETTGG